MWTVVCTSQDRQMSENLCDALRSKNILVKIIGAASESKFDILVPHTWGVWLLLRAMTSWKKDWMALNPKFSIFISSPCQQWPTRGFMEHPVESVVFRPHRYTLGFVSTHMMPLLRDRSGILAGVFLGHVKKRFCCAAPDFQPGLSAWTDYGVVWPANPIRLCGGLLRIPFGAVSVMDIT